MKNLKRILLSSMVTLLMCMTALNSSAQKAGEMAKDVDGNMYQSVVIGTQTWLTENLKVTRYSDATDIKQITDKTQWAKTTAPAFCWYDNDVANKDEYGALYNWHAVNGGNICPKGWHVPTDAEWTTLEEFVGGAQQAAEILKEKGTTHWKTTSAAVSDPYHFSARAAGFRNSDGDFTYQLSDCCWWTATSSTSTYARNRSFSYYDKGISQRDIQRSNGYSIRCVMD